MGYSPYRTTTRPGNSGRVVRKHNKTVVDFRTECNTRGGVCNASHSSVKEMKLQLQFVHTLDKIVTPEMAQQINKPKFRVIKRNHAR